MKKLVYMLSLAIGLIMTGCAQWETYESMAPDTWGPVAELTVNTPDTLTSNVLPIEIITKNATHIAFRASEGRPIEVDFTELLRGGNQEVKPEGDTLQLPTIDGVTVTAGNTYYVYVVAANKAGVQTTFEKAIGAVDIERPYIKSTFPLTATGNGTAVTLAFNENIVRESGMGNISYQIFDYNKQEFATGVLGDANINASGSRLTVSLPTTVVFAENQMYVVLLSFEEGVVADTYGNKMAAINNYLDESGVPNGPWWAVDTSAKPEPNPGSFFTNGDYGFVFTYATSQGSQDLGSMTTFEYQGEVVLPGANWFGEDVDAQHFTISGFMADNGFITSNGSSYPMNGYVYAMVDAGQEFEMMTIAHDPVFSDYPCFGEDSQNGMQFTFWLASIEGQSAYPYVDFMVMEEEGIKLAFNANSRVAIVGPHPEDPTSLALFADLEDLIIAPSSMFEQSARVQNVKVKWLDEPVAVKKAVGMKKHMNLKK